MSEDTKGDFTAIELTAEIVAAYVGANTIKVDDLSGLIASVHGALIGTTAPKVEEPKKREPAVSVRKSIDPDFLTSLIDGKKYKSLKRHLATKGLTPDDYRAEFGLPKDYPMVAANYSAQRSSLAKSLGLGRKATAAQRPAAPVAKEAPKTRGRKKAA